MANCTFWNKPWGKATNWRNFTIVSKDDLILNIFNIFETKQFTLSCKIIYTRMIMFQWSCHIPDTLVSFMTLFLLVPLISPTLDIIHPLNETRSRQQLLKVNYIFFNHDNYFFYVYLELFWAAMISVLNIIAADWLYMLIIHHNSGLFAVCG